MEVIVLDPNEQQRLQGGLNISESYMKSVNYETTSEQVAAAITSRKLKGAFLVGISLGGKIVYDFAAKFPHLFLGGVVTDFGTGPFRDTELHRFVYDLVTKTPLHLPWPEVREYLRENIPERSLRSLIQSQISYPDQKPPGLWKSAMKNLREMLERQSIGQQYPVLKKAESQLSKQGSKIIVLQAERISGIGKNSIPDMDNISCIKRVPVADSSHFLHVTHKDLICKTVLETMNIPSHKDERRLETPGT